MRFKLSFWRVLVGGTLLLIFFVAGPSISRAFLEEPLPYTEPLMARWERTLGGQVYISPTRIGDATFRKEFSFIDEPITLEIHDYNSPNIDGRTIKLGKIGYGFLPKKAYWSGDGTVFVVGENDEISGTFYDLRRQSSQLPKATDDFKAFIQSRGGAGPNVMKG